MLVKAGTSVALNMTGIDSVILRQETETSFRNPSIFSKGIETKKTVYNVEINYRNADCKKDQFTIKCGENYGIADSIHKEVLSQVKEIENVGATQALEEAIKNA